MLHNVLIFIVTGIFWYAIVHRMLVRDYPNGINPPAWRLMFWPGLFSIVLLLWMPFWDVPFPVALALAVIVVILMVVAERSSASIGHFIRRRRH